MTELATIASAVRDRVATVTMNRPQALNAWTSGLARRLSDVLGELESDQEVRVVDDDRLGAEVGAVAARLAAGPPGSYASIKRTINRQLYPQFEELLELEATLQQRRAESADFAEGVLSFIQKREAEFTGR